MVFIMISEYSNDLDLIDDWTMLFLSIILFPFS